MHTTRVFTRWLIRAIHSCKQAHNYNEGLVYAKYGTPKDVLQWVGHVRGRSEPYKTNRLQAIEIPPVEQEDVKVKVLAAPVNPSDINVIQG